MATHTITKTISGPGGALTSSAEYTSGGSAGVDELVPAPSTDLQIFVAIGISALKSLFIVATQDVTLKTNNSATPDNTFSLLAGKPLEWQHDSYHASPLSADVTSVFVTLAGTDAAVLSIRVLQDATP